MHAIPVKTQAILVHGFAGKTSFMKEIEETLREESTQRHAEEVGSGTCMKASFRCI